jgi:hypothetical protein
MHPRTGRVARESVKNWWGESNEADPSPEFPLWADHHAR